MIPSVYRPSASPMEVRLGRRQTRLSAYAYAALRSMELSAAWIASTPGTRDKVLIGTKLGIDGGHLRRLMTRLDEMFVTEMIPSATASIESNFTRAAALTDPGARMAFLAAMSRELERSMATYRAEEHDCADEPSVMLLASLGTELLGLAERLERQAQLHPTPEVPFALVPIEQGLADAPVTYSGTEPIPERVSFPARDPGLTFADKPASFGNGFDPAGLAPFFSFMYIDVEIAAAEVCARMIVDSREMPIDFKVDMARQCWDEVRHAIIGIDALHWTGAKEGDYPYCAVVWRRFMTGENLAERLALQQLVQEGNACDRAVSIARGLRRAGHDAIADIMDQITADEVIHVRFGNRWLMELCKGSTEEYARVVAAAQAKLRFPMVAVNPVVRQMCGFPSFYMKNLNEEFKRQSQEREASTRSSS